VVHLPDAPLLFTLLTANLRRGRPVELFRGATQLAAYEERRAPAGTTSGNLDGIYQQRELLGRAPLAEDGSAKVRIPAMRGVILELQDDSGNPVVTMAEEHQLGPGENISMGIVEPLFDAVCGGCHGTVSGREIDVFVTPDALTSASRSLSRDSSPTAVSP
jgi:Hydrazine synthase alpha subunit middle domain